MYHENKNLFDYLGILEYHDKGFKGQGVTIAVFDMNFNKEDVEDFDRFENVEAMPMGINALENWSEDGNDHGVLVLDTIRQIAPEAKVYFMGSGFLSTFLARAKRVEADIVTVSLGIETYSRVASEEAEAILFASTGNDGIKKPVLSPAREKEWVGVAAAHFDDETREVKPAYYSTDGEGVEVTGVSGVTVKDYKGKKKKFFGTSCASPIVAAMTALYMSAKDLDREGARKFLEENAHDMGEEDWDEKTGHGLFILPEPPKEEKEVIEFKDIKDHWAEEAIKEQAEKGILKGYEDGTFKPDNFITRAEMAVILIRIEKDD